MQTPTPAQPARLPTIRDNGQDYPVIVTGYYTYAGRKYAKVRAVHGSPFYAWSHGGWVSNETTSVPVGLIHDEAMQAEKDQAAQIAAAHPLNPEGAYERILERVYRKTEAQARKIDELASWYGEPGVEEFTPEGSIELDFSPEDGIRYTFCVTPAGEVS